MKTYYYINNKLRDFKDEHPYLFAGLEMLVTLIMIAMFIAGIVGPIVLAVIYSIWFLLLIIITLPVLTIMASFISDCFLV